MTTQTEIDPVELRRTLGQFATGVVVVSTLDADGYAVGLTVNSFNAVSLSPPLVLWSLTTTSSLHQSFEVAEGFAVNVLSVRQQSLSERFASQIEDRFADVGWAPGEQGLPLIEGCSAWFECRTVARHDGGDHVIYLGEVLRMASNPQPPLVYWGGDYRQLAD